MNSHMKNYITMTGLWYTLKNDNMKKTLFIICLGFMLSASTCYDDEGPETRILKFENKSDQWAFVSVCFNYPDTNFYVSDYYIYYLKPQKTDGMQFEPDELFERNKVLQVFFVSFIPEEGMLGDSILARYEFTRAALDRCDWTVVYPKEN